MMSAEEVRNLKYKNNREKEEKELLDIQDKIVKEIEKEDGRDWIDINKISDTNFEILTSLGYYIKKYYGNAYDQIDSYYTISW